MLGMSKLDLKDGKQAKDWCLALQEKMNNNSSMAERHSLEYSGQNIVYSMKTYGVETNSSVLDEAFFESKDYKSIESYSSEVESMLVMKLIYKKALKN